MANNKDLVSKEILQKATQDILQNVVDHLYEYEEYTDEEISDLFNLTPEEVKSISEIINDEVISKYKIWSSKGTSDKIDSAKIECQDYANNLIKNISSIELEWCETTLPTTGETNKIYILPKTVDSNIVNTLNIWNTSTNSYVSIGNLEVDLTQYFTKDEINTMLTDYAKKSEVLPMDSVINDTSTASGTNVLSASVTINELNKRIDKTSINTAMSSTPTDEKVLSEKAVKTELDLKANDDEVVKKTDITTTINSTSTDDVVPTSKAVYENTITSGLHSENSNYNIDTINNYATTHVNPTDNGDMGTYPAEFEWGTFLQLPAKDYRSQILISTKGMYYRIMNGEKWQPWYKVNATEVTDTTTYPKETT